jgi:hypothetical protein
MIIHVEFSSIYLPIVKFKGQKEQMIITKKLFSYKRTKTLFPDEKSKYIESKKNLKKHQFMITLNFITKELFNNNIEANNHKFNDDIQLKSDKKDQSSKKVLNKLLYNKKKSSYFRNSSLLNFSNFNNFNIKLKSYFEMSKLKPISLLQQKKFFKIDSSKKINNNLKTSLIHNLLYYKINGSDNKNEINDNKKYIQKLISIIHENKVEKKVNNSNIDYYEILKRIKGKKNLEIVLRAMIKEGETLLFNQYFIKNIRNIDINSKDENGNSFLILSIKEGMNNIIKLLLENGIDVNIKNNSGNTALHYALSGKNFEVADALKLYGAKEDCYNLDGLTPWDCVGKSLEEKY